MSLTRLPDGPVKRKGTSVRKGILVRYSLSLLVFALASAAHAVPTQPGNADYRWLFDEGVGTTIADTGSLGAGKTASFIGSPSWSTQTPFAYAGNHSLDANGAAPGAGAAIVNAFNTNMGTATTVSMWVRYENHAGATTHYVHDTSGGSGRTLWYYNANGTVRGDAIYWNSQNKGGAGLSALPNGGWTHLALVRDGTDLKVYENGSHIRTDAVPAGDVTWGTLHFGNRISQNEFFVGQIDEYAYWTSALSDDNIEWLSQNSLTGMGGPIITNVALNKPYAWSRAPGQAPNSGPHYRDDHSVHGLHDVHTSGVGVFDLGDLSDGVIQTGGAGGAGQPVVGQWGGFGNAPQADVTFDLGEEFILSSIVVGTHVTAGANNNAPSTMEVAFSSDNVLYSTPTLYDLEAMFGPLSDGHHDLAVQFAETSARFVRMTFGPGSFTEPGGQDPDEKWMLDEIRINGYAVPIPEPATASLALLGLGGLMMRRRRAA